ncbi:hypothetical protein [[Clostridium] polysaccharolyticum]|uniref:ABC transporter domain-containing protein n=1 Tax=[Clostridium] polysaccharolyticum TaxID=29364 RepID=A0A1H9Z872_9FIRM|nr:hypothetical protein [[Clostridium] polysaccharolyticum]SES77673.1 hypothetical protein SAMN04487772_10349 [[Clostridium] polysaccharolyticum]
MDFIIRKKVGGILFIDISSMDKVPLELRNIVMAVQEGVLIGVHFSDKKMISAFLDIVKDNCVELDGIRAKENLREYKRKVDVLPKEKIESSLSCKEYVYMYCMLRNEFCNEIGEKFEKRLKELHIEYLSKMKLEELKFGFQVMIRCIADQLIGIRLLIAQNEIFFENSKEARDLKRVFEQFKREKGIGLLLSTNRKQLEALADVIYDTENEENK